MLKRAFQLFWLLSFVLVNLFFVQPAQAGKQTIPFVIKNATSQVVRYKLEGSGGINANYDFIIQPGQTGSYKIVPGAYRIVETVCGTRKIYTWKLTYETFGPKGYNTTKKSICNSSPGKSTESKSGTAKFKVNNLSAETVTIRLTGTENVTWVVKPKETRNFTLKAGTYKYDYTLCGKRYTGQWVFPLPKPLLKFSGCESANTSGGRDTTRQMANLKLQNQTDYDITVKLVGPETKTWTIRKRSSYDFGYILAGNYTYTITGCGGSIITGKLTLAPKTTYQWRFQCKP